MLALRCTCMILQEIRNINVTQKDIFFNKVVSALWTLRGKRVAALGLAFKGETDDVRESPALDIIRKMLQAGARVTAYDPAATERARDVLPAGENLSYAGDLYEAVKGADAAVILTDWKEFARIDLERLKQALQFPIVIDGRNLFDPHVMHDHGFTYVSVGRATNFLAGQDKARKPSMAVYASEPKNADCVMPSSRGRPIRQFPLFTPPPSIYFNSCMWSSPAQPVSSALT